MNKTSQKISKIAKSDNRLSEIIRFCITGGLATILQYGIYVVFYNAVGVKAVPSTLISYAISFIFNFFMTSRFTFKTKANARNGLGFVVSHAINMGMQTGMVAIFKEIVGGTLALLPALAICIPMNYLLVRYAFKGKFAQK